MNRPYYDETGPENPQHRMSLRRADGRPIVVMDGVDVPHDQRITLTSAEIASLADAAAALAHEAGRRQAVAEINAAILDADVARLLEGDA